MKHGAIFDMDGLLFDTERLFSKSWGILAVQMGQVPNPEFPVAVAGTNGAGQRDLIRRYYPDVDPFEMQSKCIAYVAESLKKAIPERPGAREILAFFRAQGAKLALASSSHPDMILHNLRLTGLESYFDVVVSGNDVERGKPAPDIFLLAAERLGLAPEDCYVLEDGVQGARAGIAARCITIMIPDLFAPTDDIRAGCAGIFPSLADAQQAIASGLL